MKESDFRNWVKRIWLENSEERSQFRQLPYSIQEYWKQYKFWLKREYRAQNERKN